MTGSWDNTAPMISLSGQTLTITDDQAINVADITLTNSPEIPSYICTQVDIQTVECTFDTALPNTGTIEVEAIDTVENTSTETFNLEEPTSSTSTTKGGIIGTRFCKDGETTFCRPRPNQAVCLNTILFTNFMKYGDNDGTYSNYYTNTVTEIAKLQNHINTTLYPQAAGPVDRIFRSLTKQGVERIQNYLNTTKNTNLVIDGIVGPLSRAALNLGC